MNLNLINSCVWRYTHTPYSLIYSTHNRDDALQNFNIYLISCHFQFKCLIWQMFNISCNTEILRTFAVLGIGTHLASPFVFYGSVQETGVITNTENALCTNSLNNSAIFLQELQMKYKTQINITSTSWIYWKLWVIYKNMEHDWFFLKKGQCIMSFWLKTITFNWSTFEGL